MTILTSEALDAILAPISQITRRVTIYESDGVTPYVEDAAIEVQGGSVVASYDSDTRRTLSLSLHDEDGMIEVGPGGLWYDKIIKVWRGVSWVEGGETFSWETPLGEFYIDNIRQKHHPHEILQINGRDASKVCTQSKFGYSTTFVAGYNVVDLVKAIAANAGITKFACPASPETTGREFQFDGSSSRWSVMKEIATAYSFDLYFGVDGFMVMEKFRDPALGSISHTFEVGTDLVSFEKLLNDSRLYNHIIVTGDSTDTIPSSGEAINTAPSSPTNVNRIGDRTLLISSPLVESDSQAQELAEGYLSVSKLESFEFSWQSVVVPSLDVGRIVEFQDPYASAGQPIRYLLTDVTIPLSLEAMSTTGKRVEVVA